MSKYRFALVPKIKGYVEWQLEHYHEDKWQLAEYRKEMIPNATPSYSLTGGVQGGQVSNQTESAGIRLTTSPYILATERSIKAIDCVLIKCDKTDIQLIDLVYWKRSYSVTGAAMVVYLSPAAAYVRINKLLTAIALELGYTNI